MNMPDLNFILLLTSSAIKNQKSAKDFQALSRVLSQVMASASNHGISMGLNLIHYGLGHVSMATAPMIAIGKVGSAMGTTFQLYDLLAASKTHCYCGNCGKILQFIIDKRESKAAKTAVASSVVGAPFVATHAIIRNAYKLIKGTKGAERSVYSKQLLLSAKPEGQVNQNVTKGKKITMEINIQDVGCPVAQATIATLFKEPTGKQSDSPLSYPKTISAISAPDNAWLNLKQAMN